MSVFSCQKGHVVLAIEGKTTSEVVKGMKGEAVCLVDIVHI